MAINLQDTSFIYTFDNFFHPLVGELIQQLNRKSLPGLMDADWQASKTHPFFNALYHPSNGNSRVQVESFEKEIDVLDGPYANYNWELFFHLPLTIAVHLSKTQRFAESQRWFHYIFDPTANDQTENPRRRFWRFLAFRSEEHQKTIDEIVRLLSIPHANLTPADREQQEGILASYNEIRDKPFQPHAVARSRPLAYRYWVVMKYLDNLIAWGDHLFAQDTIESINEATQRYVLAANLLGPRPQRIPPRGSVQPKSFAQLKVRDRATAGLGPIGNALVDLEGQFPVFAASSAGTSSSRKADGVSPLFGIGRTLYFCIPRNDKLLGYWDTVADRLFKIRHCMNIAGIVRSLTLFEPPLDPGLLVKATAAGIDIGSIVNGSYQSGGPLRALPLIQKALELCGEVRGLGGALLAALEKGDGEHLALVRQRHEIQIQQMAQEVRFLQWKAAEEATNSLLTSRATALERLRYYQRLLGLPPDPNVPSTLMLARRELNEANFDTEYTALVGQYDKALKIYPFPNLSIVGNTSPTQQSGALGDGRLHLVTNESVDLHDHADRALAARISATAADSLSSVLAVLPGINLQAAFWGVGGVNTIPLGQMFSDVGKAVSSGFNIWAQIEEWHGHNASKTASYERRADDWMLQYNLAAHELMQIGRQILTSLIAEQIAQHEYLNLQQQIANAQEVDRFLHDKFTNEDLYLWMQGEISRLYYEYYRFAFDTARKAERTMKQELMRPEVDAQDFVKFNYWDGGRKGLLSGEALHLDLKRMEMAYHDNNKRELELTRHVSLRQLDPLALLTLKATGTCQVTVPEWLYDRDCPGHYMRRIKSVALSLPSVVGPYTSVNCTLSLLRSTLRKSPVGDDYKRGDSDDRFVDYMGTVQSIVTSTGSNDSGLFETNLRDERFLPFEGAGAESTWKLELPMAYPAFDYNTISDVILHIRYTARQGVEFGKVKTASDSLFQEADRSNLALLFSLRYDFPTEWAAFLAGTDSAPFTAVIRRDYFPYFTRGKTITINGLDLYGEDVAEHHVVANSTVVPNVRAGDEPFTLTLAPNNVLLRNATAQVFLIIRYTI